MHEVTVVDTTGKAHLITYKTGEYRNFMELIINRLYEEIGDCKGRAWCGTCVVKLLSGTYSEEIGKEEHIKLRELRVTSNQRLSCQLLVNKDLHKTKWSVAGPDWF